MSASGNDHAVFDVYDRFRTSRLNIKYQEAMLRPLVRWNTVLEIALGISACSGFTALWFFQCDVGKRIIEVLSASTAIIAVARTVLKLELKIRNRQEMLDGYRILHHDLGKIVILIHQKQAYDADLRQQFISAVDRERDLVKKSKDFYPNRRLLLQLYEEVNQELPAETFYVPKEH